MCRRFQVRNYADRDSRKRSLRHSAEIYMSYIGGIAAIVFPTCADRLGERKQAVDRTTFPVGRRWMGAIVRLLRELCSASLNVVLFVMFAAAVLLNRPILLPEHIGDTFIAQVESVWPAMDLELGSIDLFVARGWRPSVSVSHMVVSDVAGREVVRLDDLTASLSMRSLLLGQVRPKRVWIGTAYAQVSGFVPGTVGSDPVSGAVSATDRVAGLLGSMDHWLTGTRLGALQGLEIGDLYLGSESQVTQGQVHMDTVQVTVRRTGDTVDLRGYLASSETRTGSGTLSLGFSVRSDGTGPEFDIAAQNVDLRGLASVFPTWEWTGAVQTPVAASISGTLRKDGRLAPLSGRFGLAPGHIWLGDAAIPLESASATFRYDPDLGLLNVDSLSIESPMLSVSGSSTAVAIVEFNDRSLVSLSGRVAVSDAVLAAGESHGRLVALHTLTGDFRLEPHPFHLVMENLRISGNGGEARLDGVAEILEDGQAYSVDIRVGRITPEHLMAFWPETWISGTRSWVAANVDGGVMRDIDAELRIMPGKPTEIAVGFRFEGSQVRFLRQMPPIQGAAGDVSLADGRFVVTATQGVIETEGYGRIDLAGTSFDIPDVTSSREPLAVVGLRVTGPIPAAISLLDREPLSLLRNSTLPVDMADGHSRVEGELRFPLAQSVQFGQVGFEFSGILTEVSSDVLLQGQTLGAERLSVIGDRFGITIEGKGTVGALPFEARWFQELGVKPLQPGIVSGKVEFSPEAAGTFGLELPSGMVSGTGLAEFEMRLDEAGAKVLNLTLDLAGIGLSLEALGWNKTPEEPGTFTATARLDPVPRVTWLSLEAGNLVLAGNLEMRPDGSGPAVVVFERIQVSDWIDVSGRVAGLGDGQGLDVVIAGGHLDLRRLPRTAAGSKGRMSLRMDTLTVSNGIRLHDMQGILEFTDGIRGKFSGKLNGTGAVNGSIRETDDGIRILAGSDEAGRILRGLRILRGAGDGGTLELALNSTSMREGRVKGTARIENLRVTDAPAIVALLNSVSLIGLINEMTGQGLHFSTVDARFEANRDGEVTVYEASAVGPSIGLSADGVVNTMTGAIDIAGVISPLYWINSVGRLFSRKGEGVVGFNYRLRGTISEMEVSVNPISGLLPGFLRGILRHRPPPTEKPED